MGAIELHKQIYVASCPVKIATHGRPEQLQPLLVKSATEDAQLIAMEGYFIDHAGPCGFIIAWQTHQAKFAAWNAGRSSV